jgi:integrase
MSEAPFSVQRFRGGWAVVWDDPETGNRRRFRLYAPDRLGAEAEARRRWQAGDGAAWTVGRAVNAYIDAREAAGIATAGRMRDAWKAMAALWDDVRPGDIDADMCRGYAGQRGKAAATVRYELAMLGQALRWAEQNKHIDRAPRIWLPALPPRRERHLSREQVDALIAAAVAPHVRLYMEIAYATACRPSAILALRWAQVDLEAGVIRFNPEGRVQTVKRRPTLPMTAHLQQLLRTAHAARACDHVIEHGGAPLASIKKGFAAAAARAGIEATPYSLRHTAAVHMANAGVPMAEIASFLGHTDSRTTERVYARFLPDYLAKAASALDRGSNEPTRLVAIGGGQAAKTLKS